MKHARFSSLSVGRSLRFASVCLFVFIAFHPVTSHAQTVLLDDSLANKVKAVFNPTCEGFYQLSCINASRQDILPVYVPDPSVSLRVSFAGQTPQVTNSPENRALSAFYAAVTTTQKAEFQHPEARTQLRRQLLATADSLVQHNQLAAPVERYLGIWALLLNDSCDVRLLDSPIATCFSESGPLIIRKLVGKGTLHERVARLYQHIHDNRLRATTVNHLLTDYTRQFRFNSVARYEEGLAELTTVTTDFALDSTYMAQFQQRKASVVGTPFPADVQLKDASGRVFDFASLRGKYVYIDLWASWCIPCIKEVPALKQLEQELNNPDVVFISVSIDTRQEAWLKKKEQLQLGGIQLIDSENALAKALNVSGIPFFVIYDADGKLHTYNAPRPSHPQLKHLLTALHP